MIKRGFHSVDMLRKLRVVDLLAVTAIILQSCHTSPSKTSIPSSKKTQKENPTDSGENTSAPSDSSQLAERQSRVVFIDDRVIATKNNIAYKINLPEPTGERLIVADRPWESGYIGGFTSVLEDNDRIHLYYDVMDSSEQFGVAYAVSTDRGKTWTKPDLGIIQYNGSTNNNLILRNHLGTSAFFTSPSTPSTMRICLVTLDSNNTQMIRMFCSADGLHFNAVGAVPFLAGSAAPYMTLDSQNVVFYDHQLDRYLVYARCNYPSSKIGGFDRRFVRAESKDLVSFENFQLVLQADNQDPPDFDFYTTAATEYIYAPNAYLMFPAGFQHTAGDDGTVDIRFALSADSVVWKRPMREPIIARGSSGAWNGGTLYAGYGLTRDENKLYLYYTGLSATHHGPWVKDGVITRASYRIDGFVSLDAADTPGEVTFSETLVSGSRLELNAIVADSGEMKVELLDSSGTPIPGYTLAEAKQLTGDHISMAVSWNTKNDVSALLGTHVKLHVKFKNAKLFAFQWR